MWRGRIARRGWLCLAPRLCVTSRYAALAITRMATIANTTGMATGTMATDTAAERQLTRDGRSLQRQPAGIQEAGMNNPGFPLAQLLTGPIRLVLLGSTVSPAGVHAPSRRVRADLRQDNAPQTPTLTDSNRDDPRIAPFAHHNEMSDMMLT